MIELNEVQQAVAIALRSLYDKLNPHADEAIIEEIIERAEQNGLYDLASQIRNDHEYELNRDVMDYDYEDRLDLTVIPRTVVSQADRRVRL